MWKNLPETARDEYKKMILAFASLTEMFAQKADNEEADTVLSPIINSKYQETVFQRAFHASAEDIGNTSYDAGIKLVNDDGTEVKYLIGIKTFGIASGAQKVAQFKAYHNEWSKLINQLRENAIDDSGKIKTKEQIDEVNKPLYLDLAKRISYLRNMRIASSESNIQGFSVSLDKDDIQSVYHVLMPSKKGDEPMIYVGETSYDKINENNIEILGCTSSKNPTNFNFTDGNHVYRFTSADSQLLMDFKNNEIVKESWEVKYVDDAYSLFSNLSNQIYGSVSEKNKIVESYSWMITNKKDMVELFSGFNSFYGVGSKLALKEREKAVGKIKKRFAQLIFDNNLVETINDISAYLKNDANSSEKKMQKVNLRKEIMKTVEIIKDPEFINAVEKLLYRPYNEMYIPIPNSKVFHEAHPDFFGEKIGTFKQDGKKLALTAQEREFNLIFEPSGEKIRSYIAQDSGKAIESTEKQTYLGEWILRGVFQLEEREPLTEEKLKEVGINGLRLYKVKDSNDIHLQFIWIDKDNLPEDYIK